MDDLRGRELPEGVRGVVAGLVGGVVVGFVAGFAVCFLVTSTYPPPAAVPPPPAKEAPTADWPSFTPGQATNLPLPDAQTQPPPAPGKATAKTGN
jgi:hypothetical protein